MIRLRINRGVTPEKLLKDGFIEVKSATAGTYYSKHVGPYEIMMKVRFPYNLRIQDWDDNRAPWILMKFLLQYEAGDDVAGKIKVSDSGRFKILGTNETLELIEELNKWSDVCNRLTNWYKDFLDGKINFF